MVINYGSTAIGQRYKWKLVDKLGEGDAGEVYLVESLLEGKQAILKRPRRNAYSSDILRQAAQIRSEGVILNALGSLSFPEEGTRITIPALLDQSPPEDGAGERLFIVVERAPGFDLKYLHQVARYGLVDGLQLPNNQENNPFLQMYAGLDQIPEAILIRCLYGTLCLLESVHTNEVWNERSKQAGVIWNDVKAEHLYWDPSSGRLTVIDWGNGQFLEADGTSKDRQYSRKDDDRQFIQEMGDFLAEANPGLRETLEWPEEIPAGSRAVEEVKALRARLAGMHEDVLLRTRRLRADESDIYSLTRPEMRHLTQIDELHRQITTLGETPDYAGALNFHSRLALQLASEANLEPFQEVCGRAARLEPRAAKKWDVLCDVAEIALQQEGEKNPLFSNALAAGVTDDWPGFLWELLLYTGSGPLPEWWESVSHAVRALYLELEEDVLTPYTAVSRTFYTLQSSVLQMGDKQVRQAIDPQNQEMAALGISEELLNTFNEEVIKKWKDLEPAPPNAGIDYREIAGMINEIEAVLPGTKDPLERALAQPNAQADIVLSAWERKEFEIARRGLRMLLIWDPDRRRLRRAERAMSLTPQWLARVSKGAKSDEPFYEFITSIELEGRRLRNQVGKAEWLDGILDALKRLRKGAKHADLLMEHPHILNEIPWLSEYRSREILSLPHSHSLTLDRDKNAIGTRRTISGVAEGRFGRDQELSLGDALDTWTPEARGSSARVFTGDLRSRDGMITTCAVKIMRPDRAEYALPLFREEAQILTLLRDVPGVSPLIECGYLKLEEGQALPREEGHLGAGNLSGQVVRYGAEEVQNYLASLDRYLGQGWTPYLALEKRDNARNLMVYCDAGRTHGWFLPLREGLIMAVQICDILQSAHERNIIYRDHKILHYYWDAEVHGVTMIDWNIAKRQPQGLEDEERQFDLVQFGARALHHIMTGRPAAGSLPLGPNRPEDIEGSAMNYPVNWTYDDERLPNRVKEILEQVLNQGYTHFRELRKDLVEVYEQIPDPVTGGKQTNNGTIQGNH